MTNGWCHTDQGVSLNYCKARYLFTQQRSQSQQMHAPLSDNFREQIGVVGHKLASSRLSSSSLPRMAWISRKSKAPPSTKLGRAPSYFLSVALFRRCRSSNMVSRHTLVATLS